MMIDLTTAVDQHLMEKWLSTQENRHIAAGHIGTHLDIYNKSEIPLEYFRCSGVLIDVSNIAESREITIEDIAGIDIPKDSFVLIRTSRSETKKYGTPAYFSDHPQLSHELIEHLLNKNIRFIGIDYPGIRRGQEHEPADRLCESNGVYVIENLSNLNQLTEAVKMTIYTMWFDNDTATGLLCRVLAETT